MDFNKIKHFSSDEYFSIDLLNRPNLIFKYYANQCDLNEWLKIFYENKTFALWMNQWTKCQIFQSNLHLCLTDLIYPINLSHLQYFIRNQPGVQCISVNSDIWSCLNELENCQYLNKLYLNVNSTIDVFPTIDLPCLETVAIKVAKYVQIQNINLTNWSNLKHLTLANFALNDGFVLQITNMSLESLHFKSMTIAAETQLHRKLFANKENLSIENCHSDFLKYFLHDETLNLKKLKLQIDTNEKLDFRNLLLKNQLQSIVIKMEIDTMINFENFHRLTNLIPQMVDCTWKISISIPEMWDMVYSDERFHDFHSFRNFLIDIQYELESQNTNVSFEILNYF